MHPQSPGPTLHETLHHSTQALADTDVFAYAQYLNIDLDRHPEVRSSPLPLSIPTALIPPLHPQKVSTVPGRDSLCLRSNHCPCSVSALCSQPARHLPLLL